MEGRIKLSGFLIGGSVVCAMVTTQYEDGYFFMGNFFLCITDISLARRAFGQRDNLSETTKLIIA